MSLTSLFTRSLGIVVLVPAVSLAQSQNQDANLNKPPGAQVQGNYQNLNQLPVQAAPQSKPQVQTRSVQPQQKQPSEARGEIKVYHTKAEIDAARRVSHFKITPQVGAVNNLISGSDIGNLLMDHSASQNAPNYNVSSVTSYAAGIDVEYVKQRWAFETGLLYRRIGYKVSSQTTVGSRTTVYKDETYLNYVSVPLLAKLYFGNPLGSAVFLKAGALASGLAKTERNVDPSTGSRDFSTNSASTPGDLKYQNFLIEAVGGAGGQFSLSPGIVFTAEALFGRSLTSPVDRYNSLVSTTVMGLAGLRFDL